MDEDTSLGAGFWSKIVLLTVVAVGAAALFVVIFGRIWYAWGLFGAFLALGAGLMAFGWAYDRRERKRRQRLTA
jgi:hypothetical protein